MGYKKVEYKRLGDINEKHVFLLDHFNILLYKKLDTFLY
jgi:hypothetical protein